MKAQFTEYLETIGITGALTSKVEDILKFYEQVLGIAVEDIFVSEYLNQDGSRVYENLCIFNKDLFCEAKFFLTQDNFDVYKILNSVYYFEIYKTDYDAIQNITTDKSRLNIQMIFYPGTSDSVRGSLKASKENCKKLIEVFTAFIKPNLINQER